MGETETAFIPLGMTLLQALREIERLRGEVTCLRNGMNRAWMMGGCENGKAARAAEGERLCAEPTFEMLRAGARALEHYQCEGGGCDGVAALAVWRAMLGALKGEG